MRAGTVLGLAALLAAGFSRPVRAAEETPLRAVFRVVRPADREVVVRARGQLADLAVELLEVATAGLEPALADQMQAARDLAAAHDAAVVVWLDWPAASADRAEAVVFVADPAASALLVREVYPEASPSDAGDDGATATFSGGPRSGVVEGAAIVIRTALRAVWVPEILADVFRIFWPLVARGLRRGQSPSDGSAGRGRRG